MCKTDNQRIDSVGWNNNILNISNKLATVIWEILKSFPFQAYYYTNIFMLLGSFLWYGLLYNHFSFKHSAAVLSSILKWLIHLNECRVDPGFFAGGTLPLLDLNLPIKRIILNHSIVVRKIVIINIEFLNIKYTTEFASIRNLLTSLMWLLIQVLMKW